tara:strand:+ start:635 stop:919 length:285 start_codon:yes stop_codon:yes gene_type:complete
MQRNRVKCGFYDYEHKKWNQYELDLNLKIYPCCFYYLNDISTKDKVIDNTLDHIDNSLKTNNLEKIIKEFDKSLNENIWSSDECPKVCIKNCKV